MASKRSKYDPLYNDYVQAKHRAWNESRIRLTEGDFLRTIDPQVGWSDKQAAYYMQQLRKGEWSSANVMRRTKESSGRVHRLLLKDRTGQVVASAITMLPGGKSLHEAYMSGAMRKAALAYIEETSPPDEMELDDEDYMSDMTIAGTVIQQRHQYGKKFQWIGTPP